MILSRRYKTGELSQPLAYAAAYPPRYVSFGLQLGF
jgi:hypothetical protein